MLGRPLARGKGDTDLEKGIISLRRIALGQANVRDDPYRKKRTEHKKNALPFHMGTQKGKGGKTVSHVRR